MQLQVTSRAWRLPALESSQPADHLALTILVFALQLIDDPVAVQWIFSNFRHGEEHRR